MRRRRVYVVVAAAAALSSLSLVASAAARVPERGSAQLTVFAAASLTQVFPKIDSRPKYSFAGSNTLLAQIEQGAPADVFASANTAYPQQLFKEGKCERPVLYAYNKVVVIVPKSNPAHITSVWQLQRSNVKVVVAAKGVPVGDYTRTILSNLGISKAVFKNVVSQESDVKAVTSKIALGQADAGFVYRTDVVPVKSQVQFFRIPPWAQPPVRYSMCVVKASKQRVAARAFQARVLGPIGRGQLSGALFGLPPKKK
jgi:molybdate transport system substrate-binding protein